MNAAKKRIDFSNYLINKNKDQEQESFFNHSYKSYDNFTRFTKKINFNNEFNFGKTCNVELNEMAKYGDLITNLIIEFEIPSIVDIQTINNDNITYTNSIGFSIYKEIDLYIGGNLIDRHNPQIMDIYSELLTNNESRTNIDNLINKISSQLDANGNVRDNNKKKIIYTPLQFWFCRNMFNHQLNLPLFLLYRDEIELRMKIKNFNEVIITPGNLDNTDFTVTNQNNFNISKANLIVEYIIFEDEERRRLLESSLNQTKYFMIYQVQEIEFNINTGTNSVKIDIEVFKYLITQLFWVFVSNSKKTRNRHLSYSVRVLDPVDGINVESNPISKCRISYDKQDVVDEHDSRYFIETEPYLNNMNNPRIGEDFTKFINTFSFCINPTKLEQPSGVCNFSSLHCPDLHLKFIDNIEGGAIKIFAVNYNILQVRNGKGVLFHTLSKSIRAKIPNKNK